jgi:predicted membrane channel-forming protein YqfA (hemolysin III family)
MWQSFKLKNETYGWKWKSLRARTFLAFFHLVNFLIMILATIYILSSSWGHTEAWRLALYSYYILMGFSGISIAYWIAIDGKRIENYADNMGKLEKKLLELEQKIKTAKPRIPDKKK